MNLVIYYLIDAGGMYVIGAVILVLASYGMIKTFKQAQARDKAKMMLFTLSFLAVAVALFVGIRTFSLSGKIFPSYYEQASQRTGTIENFSQAGDALREGWNAGK